jgi:LysM repeat protein
VVGLAALSAPAPAAPAAPAPAVVTVHPGDTLWSIAGRVAPGADPRAEVADLQRRNGLSGAALRPGQLLRTR